MVPGGSIVERRWLTVATVLGVAALVVGATALILPLAVPGYPGSLTPHSPQTLYQKRLDAPIREFCTGYNSLGNCVSFGVLVIGYDNFTVPGAAGTLGVVNVSFSLNHTCDTCLFAIYQGNLTGGAAFFGGYTEIEVAVNGSGAALGLLAAGVEHMVLFNERLGAYPGPISLALTVVYLGTLAYR